MPLLFENRGRVRRVRMVMLFFCAFAAAMVWLAHALASDYGLAPGDGGVLRPLPQRLAISALVLGLGLLPLAGMLLYARCYLLRISRRGDLVEMTVLGAFAPFTMHLPMRRIARTLYFEGNFAARGLLVHAPWITLEVEGRWLPFIADMQARHANVRAILGLAQGRPADGPPPPASP